MKINTWLVLSDTIWYKITHRWLKKKKEKPKNAKSTIWLKRKNVAKKKKKKKRKKKKPTTNTLERERQIWSLDVIIFSLQFSPKFGEKIF